MLHFVLSTVGVLRDSLKCQIRRICSHTSLSR